MVPPPFGWGWHTTAARRGCAGSLSNASRRPWPTGRSTRPEADTAGGEDGSAAADEEGGASSDGIATDYRGLACYDGPRTANGGYSHRRGGGRARREPRILSRVRRARPGGDGVPVGLGRAGRL